MNVDSASGSVVWHDLFTNDLEAAKTFYSALFGFEYVVEHSSEFVWGSGEGDYCLINAGRAAHAGIVAMSLAVDARWTAYVAVDDVDDATKRAKRAGFSITREAFDIPGVGRSSIIEDGNGARIAPFVASHDYPPPEGVFVWDVLVTPDLEKTASLYGEVFGWRAIEGGSVSQPKLIFLTADGVRAAGAKRCAGGIGNRAAWIPYLAVSALEPAVEKAVSLGAVKLSIQNTQTDEHDTAILADPTGAAFGLMPA